MTSPVLLRAATAADAEAVARVHIEVWRSTYRGLLSQELLDNLDYQRRLEYWRGLFTDMPPGEFALVAEHPENGVVGFASGGPAHENLGPYAGGVYTIYLLASHQGRGIGRDLFQQARSALVEREYSGFMLWVLEGNPTCGFYEHMGGRQIGHRREQIGGQTVNELAYGWKDTQP